MAADAGNQAVAADGAGLDLDAGGQGDADDHRIVAVVVDGAHQVLEPALRAVQLVADLQPAVDDGDGQRVAVDLGDLDPGDGLVVGDDVEPAADNAELQRRTPSTSMVCGPVTVQRVLCHGSSGLAIYRDCTIYRDDKVTIYRAQCRSRYIANIRVLGRVRPTRARPSPATGTSRGAGPATPSARSRPGRACRRWPRGPGATARGSAAARRCPRRGACAAW